MYTHRAGCREHFRRTEVHSTYRANHKINQLSICPYYNVKLS